MSREKSQRMATAESRRRQVLNVLRGQETDLAGLEVALPALSLAQIRGALTGLRRRHLAYMTERYGCTARGARSPS